MGKKNKSISNNEIADLIIYQYLDEDNLDTDTEVNKLISKLPLLIENNLAVKVSEKEYIGSSVHNMYRLACKFIQDYGKFKERRRIPKKYEFGNSNTLLSNYHPKIVELIKYVLEDGKYLVKFNNDNYGILILSTSEEDVNISTDLYFVGKNFKKWRNKFYKLLEEYNKYSEIERFEYIYFLPNRTSISSTFKSFDQLIFKDKKYILNYIDNWVKSIPTYYDKYNMISKLSILLHGEPGTGKSTFCRSLAKYLNIDNITIVTPDYFSVEDREQRTNKYYTYSNNNYTKSDSTIYTIDDIDCICKSREDEKSDNDNAKILSSLLSFLDDPPTFNFVAKNNKKYPISIIVATTNYYDKLDPAIKRHGRFDLKLQMRNFNRTHAQKMCDIYDLKLEDIITGSNNPNFTIAPSKLQAICLRNVDMGIKGNAIDREFRDGRIVIHRRLSLD